MKSLILMLALLSCSDGEIIATSANPTLTIVRPVGYHILWVETVNEYGLSDCDSVTVTILPGSVQQFSRSWLWDAQSDLTGDRKFNLKDWARYLRGIKNKIE